LHGAKGFSISTDAIATGRYCTVAIDNLENLYIVSSSGQIKKLNNRGDSVAIFNGVRNYGLLQAIDVTNPLKPLLFYKDFLPWWCSTGCFRGAPALTCGGSMCCSQQLSAFLRQQHLGV
jgi:hypothetical protein